MLTMGLRQIMSVTCMGNGCTEVAAQIAQQAAKSHEFYSLTDSSVTVAVAASPRDLDRKRAASQENVLQQDPKQILLFDTGNFVEMMY
jgi:hypothetical protein